MNSSKSNLFICCEKILKFILTLNHTVLVGICQRSFRSHRYRRAFRHGPLAKGGCRLRRLGNSESLRRCAAPPFRKGGKLEEPPHSGETRRLTRGTSSFYRVDLEAILYTKLIVTTGHWISSRSAVRNVSADCFIRLIGQVVNIEIGARGFAHFIFYRRVYHPVAG